MHCERPFGKKRLARSTKLFVHFMSVCRKTAAITSALFVASLCCV